MPSACSGSSSRSSQHCWDSASSSPLCDGRLGMLATRLPDFGYRYLITNLLGWLMDCSGLRATPKRESPRRPRLPQLAAVLSRFAPCGPYVAEVRRRRLALSFRQEPVDQPTDSYAYSTGRFGRLSIPRLVDSQRASPVDPVRRRKHWTERAERAMEARSESQPVERARALVAVLSVPARALSATRPSTYQI